MRSVLTEAHLDQLANEAMLLTTELSTNAVEHARTELDVEVVADPVGITVTVSDFAAGPVEELTVGVRNDATDIDEVSERGRGLLLVDHFASRWGTTYLPTGKGVWFRLDLPGPATGTRHARVPAAATAGGGAPATPESSAPSAGAMSELMQTTPDPYAEDPLPDFATSLLTRVAEMVGAAGGVVRLDRGDGQGTQVLARYGRQPRPGNELLRVALAVHRPYTGELVLDAAPSAYARPLAVLMAERLSLHLENDRLRRADVRRQAWLTFLAEASELLAQSLDVELTMALVPQLVVPRLGQWCAVHTTDEWGRLRLAAASHADESVLPQLHQVLAETGPDSVQARLREASRNGTQVPLGAPMEGFAVPLIARGQRLGTLAVGRHQRHRHDPDEVAVLEDVARRSALAIENARIHAERRRVAHTLQQSLLPPVLPVVESIGFAAEYVPTGGDVDVGGDFYDVVPLPDGRWLVVIGDVSGKGCRRRRSPAWSATSSGCWWATASRCRRRWPGSTRRCSSGAAGATARWPWRRSAPATATGSTSPCTSPATTGRCCCPPAAGRVSSASAAPRSACSTRSPPRRPRCRSPRGTRWSSTPTVSPSGGAAGSCSAPSGCVTPPPRWPATRPT